MASDRNLNLRQFSVRNDAYLGGPGKAAEVGGWTPTEQWAGTQIRVPNNHEVLSRMKKSKAEWMTEDDVYDHDEWLSNNPKALN